MNKELTDELTRILKAVAITSPSSYSFAGRLVTLSPESHGTPGASGQVVANSNAVISSLQQTLYQYCYCHRFTGDLPSDTQLQPEDLALQLSAANTSRERWDSGWQVQQHLQAGQIVASKGGMTRVLWPGEFMTHDGPGMAPRPGASISVLVPRDSRTMQPGFYFVFADSVSDQQHDRHLVRFYWNVKASGASSLVRRITERLNRFEIPFRFKCATLNVMFTRIDAAVLYVSRRFFEITSMLLADMYRSVSEDLDPETPLFTKRLAPGFAFAEDPSNGESFGTSRCRMLAEAMWSAHEKNLQTIPDRLDEIAKQFERNSLDADRLYLNPGSRDSYNFTYPQA
jgi:type III HopA1-like effector protein